LPLGVSVCFYWVGRFFWWLSCSLLGVVGIWARAWDGYWLRLCWFAVALASAWLGSGVCGGGAWYWLDSCTGLTGKVLR